MNARSLSWMVLAIFAKCTSGSNLFANEYTCGKAKITYNISTHMCKEGQVEPAMFKCGTAVSLVSYDIRTHKCEDKKVVPLDICRQSLSDKERKRGVRCCGSRPYNPDFNTCCHNNHSRKYTIHIGMSEEEHVCCGLMAYRRGSHKAACHRSAMNDRIFKAKNKVKMVNQKICKEDTFVHVVTILKKKHRSLKVLASVWNWKLSRSTIMLRKDPLKTKRLTAKLDKNSPRKGISGDRFLIFSIRNYTGRKFFQLRLGDKIYKFPRGEKKQRKLLKRIRRRCKLFD